MDHPTLDDVALYVLQLEPDDRAELGHAREQLTELAFANRVGIAAQPHVAAAIRSLGSLAGGTAEDPAAAMREVGRLLQRALGVAPASPGAIASPDAGVPDDVTAGDASLELLADLVAEGRRAAASLAAGGTAVAQRAQSPTRGGLHDGQAEAQQRHPR